MHKRIKDVVFIGLCLIGAGIVAGMLLRRERIEQPKEFWPERFGTTNVSTQRERVFPPPQVPSPGANDWQVVLQKIDGEIRDEWAKHELQPANRASDLTIARRMSLALTGTIPSLEEIRSL